MVCVVWVPVCRLVERHHPCVACHAQTLPDGADMSLLNAGLEIANAALSQLA